LHDTSPKSSDTRVDTCVRFDVLSQKRASDGVN